LLYILNGEDDFSIRQALEEIKKGVGDPTVLAANTTLLEGQRVTVEQLRNACETVPFLAEKRLVIVEGLLGRFEPKGKSAPRKGKNTNHLDDRKAIAACVSHVPAFTMLVLVDGKISGQNILLKELAAGAEVRTFPWLRGTRLQQWVQQRVRGVGGNISVGAVDLLAKFVGSNLWIMTTEIDKLVMFAQGRSIEEADVRAVVSYAQEASVFAMVDAILESRGGVAEKLLQQLMQHGATPAYLLVMLSRQVRILVQVKELRKQRRTSKEIQDKLGLASEFVIRKALEQAGNYSLTRLKEVYHQLLEADLAIKTGKYDGELALDILLAELCQSGLVPAR